AHVLIDRRRPHEIARAQHRKRRAHALALEYTGLAHHGLEHGDLPRGDEDRELSRLTEVDLRGEQGQRGEWRVALGGERGGSHGEQCASDAVAHGVHLLAGNNAPYLFERIEKAEFHVVRDAQLAVGRVRILPGDHEYGVPLLDQVAHERVARREVENVVLHDPRRSDEDRLRVDRRRLWRVLQELDQAVTVDDLARRDGDIAPHFEVLGAGDATVTAHGALRILEPV